MCHIVLMMPILSLALFWVLPFSEALPIYTAISITSGVIYLAIMRAMKPRSETGVDAMIGHPVEVLKRINPGGSGQVIVEGEIWNAQADEILKRGEQAKVIAVKGLTLQVEKEHQNHKNSSNDKALIHNNKLKEQCHG